LLGVVTTFGSPWWIVRLYAGEPGRRVFMRGLKPMCAKDVSTFWLAHYDMDHSTQQSRTAHFEKVRARLTGIR
jgi:putative NADPH-quinone reductase